MKTSLKGNFNSIFPTNVRTIGMNDLCYNSIMDIHATLLYIHTKHNKLYVIHIGKNVKLHLS